ncbi:alpha/beta fold hydrolase [Scytonema sp. UIC 10036]|uniref:alpha/beta hydrolase n=1 Tax=Scytonema sp. UIC 10036 TaxID=2304196 RepID=UPI0012DADEDC|nr:alpha/beta fold hydrolase [Scytonema sp. UIC 10036]MUG95061.1 alpha/beta fold hydrolase [Scytonema sp. UIC 10036]
MNRQSLKKHGFKALAIGFLSTTLVTSCSQMQAQNVTTSPQMTNQVSSLTPQIQREDSFVTSEPRIQIFVRKVQLNNNTNNGRVPILLIHGGGPGSVTSFDINVPDYSVATDLASAGHTVYLMNVRGWEKSTRPAALNQPQDKNPPSVTSSEAVGDISAVMDWIRERESGNKVALIGWATGGHWAGMYTSRNNDKVSHLVMLNSLYGVNASWELGKTFENPNQPGEFNARDGGYRLVTAEGLLGKWNQTIPVQDKSQWRSEEIAIAYQKEAIESDPTSNTRQPPSLKIPNAYQLESYNLARGQKYWNAADIRVPTLVIRGERDFWSRPADLNALKNELVNASKVQTVTIPDGTHYLFLDRPEKGRSRFLQEVLSFLS